MNKEDLRIVFLGTPEFAVESLREIVDNGYNVVGVVTMPDKASGRGQKISQSPVKTFAVDHGLKVLQPVSLKDPDFIAELRALNANLFVVIAFRMLPEVVWTMPQLGTFNLHASLLPRYRGAAPINRAVMNGDTETGVTTFFLKHEIDTGDIIQQERIEILPTDNVGDVHDRLMALGAKLTVKTIADLIAGRVTPIPQDQLIGDTEPTPAPKIFKEDCKIDWTLPAEKIHNLVRGLSPYPAAWATLEASNAAPRQMKIFETRITSLSPLAPGHVELTPDGHSIIVGTATSPIEILSIQAPGKKRMPIADFLRGSRLAAPRFS